MLRQRPALCGVGAANPAVGSDAPHHNPRYRMDEEALVYGLGTRWFCWRAVWPCKYNSPDTL